jgi:hypothetical protein
MTKFRIVVFAFIALVTFALSGQPALAQSSRLHLKVVPGHQIGDRVPLAGFDDLFLLGSGFGALPPVDGGGNDEWPCFSGSSDPNAADCSQISAGGVVIGTPAYTWSLASCNGNTSASPNCGQLFWFYEDDTGDSTDNLIVSLTVKQGTNFILATGNIDLGPNSFPPGSIVVIYDDTAFGTLGETGKNNGFCAGSKKTCANPLKGIATVNFTTKVGASKISGRFNINLQ